MNKIVIKLFLAMGILIVGAVTLGIVREAFGNGFIHGIGHVLLVASLCSIFNFRLWFWSDRSLYIVSIAFMALSLLCAGVIIYQNSQTSAATLQHDESNSGHDDDEIAPGVRLNGRPDPREYIDEYRSPVNEAMGSGLADDEIAPGVFLNGRPDPREYIDEYRQKPPAP